MRNKWLTGRAIKLHLLALLVVAVCLAAGWWQLTRALGGNGPSWAYTIEWPFFAAYAGWTWWKLLHEEPEFAREKATLDALASDESASPNGNGAAAASTEDDPDEQKREAYNEYLRALSEGKNRE